MRERAIKHRYDPRGKERPTITRASITTTARGKYRADEIITPTTTPTALGRVPLKPAVGQDERSARIINGSALRIDSRRTVLAQAAIRPVWTGRKAIADCHTGKEDRVAGGDKCAVNVIGIHGKC